MTSPLEDSVNIDHHEPLIWRSPFTQAGLYRATCDANLLLQGPDVRSTPKEPDGRRKCDGGREKSAGLRGDPCGTQTAKCIETKFAGSSCNDLVIVDSSGSTIVSGHFDKSIRFWDTRSESSANNILFNGKVTSLDLTRDANYLVCCVRDDTLKLLDLRMNQVVKSFRDSSRKRKISGEGVIKSVRMIPR
ncbi:hypothetical protein GEV33_002983 [Tenebrio molitor]|uniref:Uncharacterized protein n=1 Tax=Tenebrio molitor TaxID=7067 RepID=A0A8J6HT83_TENMO|nr:hypothetical protein GEV33_002983 [Tenebrio molitor]